MKLKCIISILTLIAATPGLAETTRFCLNGEFDLGARYQGTHPTGGEMYPTSWCVVTEDDTDRVQFTATGKSNPDMESGWTVAYAAKGLVRIVNRDSPPDIEFRNTNSIDEVRATRRLDPRRLTSEYQTNPAHFSNMKVSFQDEKLLRVQASAELPLRGRVPVTWQWSWTNPGSPVAQMFVDGDLMFRAIGHWEVLSEAEVIETWAATPGVEPVDVPGEHWPSLVDMRLEKLDDGVFLVKGVRTGFQHLVVQTSEGLVVGDAPTGWVELHQIPPADLVPGLGISGLSERLIDFLNDSFGEEKIVAAALTHFHDDHAGGARAFAASGSQIFAPAATAAFLEQALNAEQMPKDRLTNKSLNVTVVPVVNDAITEIGGGEIRLVPLGSNPHVGAMLGVWAVRQGYFFVSDIHVPRSGVEAPSANRAETECWFAHKAVALLPPDVLIVNSHSSVITPVSRLEGYIKSETCHEILN